MSFVGYDLIRCKT